MSREPDFWAENQIFKNFSKSLKTCLVGVFWVFHCIFSIIWHLSREPDFSAKNRIFKNFLKCLKACVVGVFWVLSRFDVMMTLLLRRVSAWSVNTANEMLLDFKQVSFKKEVGVMVIDLVFWLTVCLILKMCY